jgi:hypothetical protein
MDQNAPASENDLFREFARAGSRRARDAPCLASERRRLDREDDIPRPCSNSTCPRMS